MSAGSPAKCQFCKSQLWQHVDPDNGRCAACDATFEAGVEAACAALLTHDAIDVLAAHWGGSGDAMTALAEHVRATVKR